MSSPAARLSTEPTRRSLSPQQAETVQRLCGAAVAELRATGYEGLTVRNVARRAGVAAATAYTYFGSREHLVTEAFWRRLAALGEPRVDRRRGVGVRVTQALADVSRLLRDEPALASACTVAMMADDPDVRQLRERVGAELHRRFALALGERCDPAALRALDLAMTGAMVRAGTGHLDYAEIPDLLAEAAALLGDGR